jgi:hypothetical protein
MLTRGERLLGGSRLAGDERCGEPQPFALRRKATGFGTGIQDLLAVVHTSSILPEVMGA